MSYQAKRTLRRDGVDVDHYRFEPGEQTSRGRPMPLADDSPETIPAIADPGGKSVAYGVYGVEVEADMVYLVHEDKQINDGGGDGASRLVQNGRVWVVIEADDSQAHQHGFQILECERDQEHDVADLEGQAANGGDNE